MMKAWMMVQTLLLVLVLTQLSWTQKDTSVQPDMDDISVSPSDSPRNDNEPGEEAYHDHEDLGRKLQPLKFSKTKDKGHPEKLKQKDGSDGDLTKHEFGNRHKRRRTKKKLRSRNKKKAQKLKSYDQTKDKKQQFKNKNSNDLHGDAHHPVIGTKAPARPHLYDASLGEQNSAPPPYSTRHHDLSLGHTFNAPFIGARAAALPSPPSPGTDASQIRNPSAKNSDTFYQDKLYQLQMLTEVQNAATQYSSTSPYLHSYHLQMGDSNHVGANKNQHDDLGGAYNDKKDDLGGAYSYNTHDSSDWELASTLSQLSSDLSETRSKIERKLTTLQNRLKERQDSLRQVRSLFTMMVYGSGYPSYP